MRYSVTQKQTSDFFYFHRHRQAPTRAVVCWTAELTLFYSTEAVGFAPHGIVCRSLAARIMSMIGNVEERSAYAACQSAGKGVIYL